MEAAPPTGSGVVVATHGVAGGQVRLGAATWFHDVLVRFGYDLPEHEHPWDGEWIDDAFEAAAADLRATGSKLVRALEALDTVPVAAERAEAAPLAVDLVVAYLGRLLRGIAVAVPCCYGQEGRALAPARAGGLLGMASALEALDPVAAGRLVPPPAVADVLGTGFATASTDLYLVVEAAGARPALPRTTARLRAASAAITDEAIAAVDRALAAACPWLDGVLDSLQRAIAARAEDGDDILARWQSPDWSVLRPSSPAVERHLPAIA